MIHHASRSVGTPRNHSFFSHPLSCLLSLLSDEIQTHPRKQTNIQTCVHWLLASLFFQLINPCGFCSLPTHVFDLLADACSRDNVDAEIFAFARAAAPQMHPWSPQLTSLIFLQCSQILPSVKAIWKWEKGSLNFFLAIPIYLPSWLLLVLTIFSQHSAFTLSLSDDKINVWN